MIKKIATLTLITSLVVIFVAGCGKSKEERLYEQAVKDSERLMDKAMKDAERMMDKY